MKNLYKYRVKLVKEDCGFISESESKVYGPNNAANILRKFISEFNDREVFVTACLNARNEINGVNIVCVGNTTGAIVDPPNVFKPAILSNSTAVIVGHNHPSGSTEPSNDDIDVTKKLVKAADVLGINLLDHLIITEDSSLSLKREYEEIFDVS